MGALDGIKILELNLLSPGALATVMLGDMGADVVRVTAPPSGNDPLEAMYDDPRKVAGNWLDRNKRWIHLDLKQPDGLSAFRRLADQADVIVDCFRPGVAARLGVDFETLSATNPGLIYCALSGFGQDGPYRLRPAHDLDFLALSGVLGLMGDDPRIPMNLVADYGGASMHGALGILLALFARERTGTGQMVDVAYLDATFALLAASPPVTAWLGGGPPPSNDRGIFTARFPYYSVYADCDGKLMSISATEPWLFRNLCDVIGRPDLAGGAMPGGAFSSEPTPEDERVRNEIAAELRKRSRHEWFESLGAANVCVGVVNDVAEAFADPQLLARGMSVRLEHPDPSIGEILQPGIAIRLGATPGSVRSLPATPGEHSAEVLADLGYDEAAIVGFRQRRVI